MVTGLYHQNTVVVELTASVEGFGQMLEGAGDDYPEASFYMVGDIKSAFDKGNKLMEVGK